MWGACRLRQFWRFNLILTHCGFLGRASAKQSEISEISEHSDGLADARTMVCRSWLTAYPPWRRWGVVWSGTACHRLPGWQLYMCSRCSGHVADTPVGEIPGYARLPPPTGVAEMLALGHRLRLGRRCGALLRCAWSAVRVAVVNSEWLMWALLCSAGGEG